MNIEAISELSQEDLSQLTRAEARRPVTRLQHEVRRVSLTPIRTTRFQRAVQTRLTQSGTTSAPLRQGGEPHSPELQSGSLRPTRHPTTKFKTQDWSLQVAKKWLIIGDSNVHKLPAYDIADLQVDAFPGATFRNAELLMDKTTCGVRVEKVILSFGINNRVQKTQETAIKQLQRALNKVKRTFPHADIFIPQINFSRELPAHPPQLTSFLHCRRASFLLSLTTSTGRGLRLSACLSIG